VIFVGLLATATAGFAFGTDDDSWRESLNISVLESGSYTVTAKRVDPAVKEIYVFTERRQNSELFFSNATMLAQEREGGALRGAQERSEA
jgi:hypothetical protein